VTRVSQLEENGGDRPLAQSYINAVAAIETTLEPLDYWITSSAFENNSDENVVSVGARA